MIRRLNVVALFFIFGALPSHAMTNMKLSKEANTISPTLQASVYARLSEKELYTMSTLIFSGKVVSIDRKPLVNADKGFISSDAGKGTTKSLAFPNSVHRVYMPLWKVLIAVDKVYLGSSGRGKTVTVYIPGAIEDIAEGEKGTWFVNTNASIVWQGERGKYWKIMPMFPGGPSQARREFSQDLANRYKAARERYAEQLQLKSRMPITP
jgi:hypothetical protein